MSRLGRLLWVNGKAWQGNTVIGIGKVDGLNAGWIASAISLTFITAIIVSSSAHARQPFKAFLAGLWPDAQRMGVSRTTFDNAFRGLKPNFKLPDLIRPGQTKRRKKSSQAEFTRAPSDYLNSTNLASLAHHGRKLAAKYKSALDRIEAQYGVDRRILLAIFGRETNFGRYRLRHDAIQVLATQAWTGRRAELFRGELLYALKMLQDGVPRTRMRASWAGAMGLTQFMPSEFYKHASAVDGSKPADLFSSVPDALASSARQLADKGWVRGQHWGFEVKIPKRSSCAAEGPPDEKPLAQWRALGFVRTNAKPFPIGLENATAYLMSPAGRYGPAFLVFENYKVIRRYNTSDLYAVFVGNLADRIAGSGNFDTAWTPIGAQKTALISDVQGRLKNLGYAIGKVDGFIGSNTRRQIGLFQTRNGLSVDCWPTERLLRTLKRS